MFTTFSLANVAIAFNYCLELSRDTLAYNINRFHNGLLLNLVPVHYTKALRFVQEPGVHIVPGERYPRSVKVTPSNVSPSTLIAELK